MPDISLLLFFLCAAVCHSSIAEGNKGGWHRVNTAFHPSVSPPVGLLKESIKKAPHSNFLSVSRRILSLSLSPSVLDCARRENLCHWCSAPPFISLSVVTRASGARGRGRELKSLLHSARLCSARLDSIAIQLINRRRQQLEPAVQDFPNLLTKQQ